MRNISGVLIVGCIVAGVTFGLALALNGRIMDGVKAAAFFLAGAAVGLFLAAGSKG